MAGMSIAAELARSRTVAVLEREEDLGYHATSRSAAALLESYGSVEVRALTRASHRLLTAAGTTTPLLTPRPLLWIADAAHADAVADLLAEQPDLRAISAADAATMCPVLRGDTLAAAAVEPGAHDIDVAALLQMYVTRASAAGAVVHRSCRLDHAERVDDRWVLHHTSGTLRADIVVNAAGAWADEVAVRFGARPCGLQPLRRTIAIARTEQPVSPAWPLVADGRRRVLLPAGRSPRPDLSGRRDAERTVRRPSGRGRRRARNRPRQPGD